MSNDAAVIHIYQHDREASRFEALEASTFTIKLHNPDDYTDLGAIPGLCSMHWVRIGNTQAVELAEAVGEILAQNRVPFRVEWA